MLRWNGSIILLERKFGGLSSSPGNKGSQTYKIKNSKRTVEDGKREKTASLLLLFPFSIPPPPPPAGFLFPLSPDSLRHKKASRGLMGRREVPQSKINTRHSEMSLPFASVREKIALFSHIHGRTKTSLTKKSRRQNNMVYGKVMTFYSISSCTFIPLAPHPSHRASIRCLFFWLDVDEVHTFSTQDARTTGEQNED